MRDYPFLSLENCYWRRDKGFDLRIITEMGEDKSNRNKSATVLKVGTSGEAWKGTIITEQLELVYAQKAVKVTQVQA